MPFFIKKKNCRHALIKIVVIYGIFPNMWDKIYSGMLRKKHIIS